MAITTTGIVSSSSWLTDLVRAEYTVKMAMLQLHPVERLLVNYSNVIVGLVSKRIRLVHQRSSLGSVLGSGPLGLLNNRE